VAGRRFLFGHIAGVRIWNFSRQLTLAGIGAAGVVTVIIVLPASADTRLELLRLLGLLVSVVLAFSSTTMVSNAMAGAMLRSVGSVQAGRTAAAGRRCRRAA
jgi:hypothetical protein